MIFPFNNRTLPRDPFDPASRIAREVADRSRRLIIGLNLDEDLQTLSGSLVVAQGKGKYLRVISAIGCDRQLPVAARETLSRLWEAPEPSYFDQTAVGTDIAIVASGIFDELSRHAGKYVDRLLAISVADPGLWVRDEYGDCSYRPICGASSLAEATGLSIIDAFPIQDLAAGGNGRNLESLPAWLLLADRSPRAAEITRIFVSIGRESRAWLLPPSDGLDIELPEIRFASDVGLSLFHDSGRDDLLPEVPALNVQGHFQPQIAEQLTSESSATKIWELARQWELSEADTVRTMVVAIADRISSSISTALTPDQRDSKIELVVDCPVILRGTFINQFERRWRDCAVIENSFATQGSSTASVLAAVSGLLSIDQSAMNVPWITGARRQRNLGRFTPGLATSWRQLVCEMADHQPPAMRLRDAV